MFVNPQQAVVEVLQYPDKKQTTQAAALLILDVTTQHLILNPQSY